MNRRKFFGMSVAAIALAGLPELVLPERKTFLPPSHGWWPSQLGAGYMREVSQYIINEDEMCYRYDAIGRDIWGTEHQFHVDTVRPAPELAARLIHDRFLHDGLIALRPHEARQFRLAIPVGVIDGRYV